MRPLLIPLLCLAFYFPVALSFSVTVGSAPNQCGSLSVTWTGGQAPFEIMLIPSFNIPRNISVPSSAFSNNQGSYQISPFPFVNGTEFLLTMSDATGFGTGGVSEVLTVGDPTGSASCNTSNPTLPFTFNLPSSLQQCSPYIFNEYDAAILPITITGFIPGGDLFVLHPPSTGTSFTWTADVAAGTTIIFSVSDAQGNSGGSSYLETVAPSNTAGCLDRNSPSSTVSSKPSSTTSSPTSSPSQTPSSSGISPGTIAGIVIGAILAVAAVIPLAICCLRRGRSPFGLVSTRNPRRPSSLELDPGIDNFQHPPIYPFPYQTDSVTHLAPPIMPGSPTSPGSSSTSPSVHASETPYTPHQHSRANSNTDSFAAFGDVGSSTMSSSSRRKAAMTGVPSYQPATRFVVHTDAEDDAPVGEAEVVELPPQYSERRAPARAHTGVSSVLGLSSTDIAYFSGQPEPLHSTSQPPTN